MRKRTFFRIFELLTITLMPWLGGSLYAQTGKLSGNAKADSLFTQAQIALSMNNDIEKAENLFHQILILQPNNAEAHAQLSAIYMGKGNYSQAQKEIMAAVNADSTNSDYKNKLAELLVQQGKLNDALTIYKALAQTSNDPTEYILKEVYIYDVQKDYEKALELLNNLPAGANVDQEALLNNKFKLYARLNNIDSASSMLKQLLKYFPDKPEYYIMSAVTYQQQKDTAAALTVIDSALAKFPTDFKMVEQIILFYAKFDTQRLERFYDHSITSDQYTKDQKTTLFFPLISLSRNDTTISAFISRKLPELAFGTPPNESAILIDASWKELQKDTVEAITICKKGIQLFPENIHLWNGLITLYRQTNQLDSVHKYNQMVVQQFPGSRFPLYSMAISSLNATDTNQAIRYLEQAKVIADTDSTVNDYSIYSILGSLYQSIDNDDSAEVNFKVAVGIDDQDPFILNNYSYLLAEKGKDLAEALQMSAKSLSVEPNEVNFLDTYGWVLYKQQKYDESKQYLEKALQNTNQPSAVLYEHLGDVEKALGNKKRAIKNWKKALKLNPGNEGLIKKLNQ